MLGRGGICFAGVILDCTKDNSQICSAGAVLDWGWICTAGVILDCTKDNSRICSAGAVLDWDWICFLQELYSTVQRIIHRFVSEELCSTEVGFFPYSTVQK